MREEEAPTGREGGREGGSEGGKERRREGGRGKKSRGCWNLSAPLNIQW